MLINNSKCRWKKKTRHKPELFEWSEVAWRVAKYGDPYSEFVLCI